MIKVQREDMRKLDEMRQRIKKGKNWYEGRFYQTFGEKNNYILDTLEVSDEHLERMLKKVFTFPRNHLFDKVQKLVILILKLFKYYICRHQNLQ